MAPMGTPSPSQAQQVADSFGARRNPEARVGRRRLSTMATSCLAGYRLKNGSLESPGGKEEGGEKKSQSR